MNKHGILPLDLVFFLYNSEEKPTHKWCTTCAKYIGIKEFNLQYKGRGGFSAQCKPCLVMLYKKGKTPNGKRFGYRTCRVCKQTQEQAAFTIRRDGVTVSDLCINCFNSRKENKTKIFNKYKGGSKKCCMCGEIWPLEDFYKKRMGGHQFAPLSYCKICLNLYMKERRIRYVQRLDRTG